MGAKISPGCGYQNKPKIIVVPILANVDKHFQQGSNLAVEPKNNKNNYRSTGCHMNSLHTKHYNTWELV